VQSVKSVDEKGFGCGYAALSFLCVLGVTVAGCQHLPSEAPAPGAAVSDEDFAFDDFEAGLAALVDLRHMVGLSAGVVHNGKLIWSKGFGYADMEAQVPATPDTPYRIGACSQAFAAVLVMKLVDEGMVDLDDPMAAYPLHSWYPNSPRQNRQMPEGVLVRHVLSSTAQGNPGAAYRYAPNQFADLTWVIEAGSGLPYPRALVEYLFEPARMERSVPGQLMPGYDDVLAQLAKPYDVRSGNPLTAAYRVLGLERLFESMRDKPVEPVELDPALEEARREVLGAAYTPLYGVNASGGAIATVNDLARFDAALDTNRILSSAGRALMWTSAKTPSGESLPQGLGWFVQDYKGTKLVWQFGESPPSISALYIKVPDRNLTFIALANTDRLCAGYDLAAGDVTASPFAELFLDAAIAEHEAEQPKTPVRRR